MMKEIKNMFDEKRKGLGNMGEVFEDAVRKHEGGDDNPSKTQRLEEVKNVRKTKSREEIDREKMDQDKRKQAKKWKELELKKEKIKEEFEKLDKEELKKIAKESTIFINENRGYGDQGTIVGMEIKKNEYSPLEREVAREVLVEQGQKNLIEKIKEDIVQKLDEQAYDEQAYIEEAKKKHKGSATFPYDQADILFAEQQVREAKEVIEKSKQRSIEQERKKNKYGNKIGSKKILKIDGDGDDEVEAMQRAQAITNWTGVNQYEGKKFKKRLEERLEKELLEKELKELKKIADKKEGGGRN